MKKTEFMVESSKLQPVVWRPDSRGNFASVCCDRLAVSLNVNEYHLSNYLDHSIPSIGLLGYATMSDTADDK
jgi:hypothetical protein